MWIFTVLLLSVVAAVVYVLVRPFVRNISFKRVLDLVATTYLFAPIVILSPFYLLAALLVWPFIGTFLLLIVAGLGSALLKFLGLLPFVESLRIWGLLPSWAWFFGGGTILGLAVYYILERPIIFPRRRAKDES